MKMASCVILFLSSLALIYSKFNGVDPVTTALAFQYIIRLGDTMTGFIHNWGDLEKKMVSIQRVFKLLSIPQENKSQPAHPDKSWPSSGSIVMKDVELRYRPKQDLVLKKLSFEIKGGEKVGVVGRTGAGKSTLASAMARIIETESGKIEFDGVDISKVSLQ